MTIDTIEKVGIAGATLAFLAKIFHMKETQQCNQNDLLVQNLIESNKNLTSEFKTVIQLLQEQAKTNQQILKILEEQSKNKNKRKNRRQL